MTRKFLLTDHERGAAEPPAPAPPILHATAPTPPRHIEDVTLCVTTYLRPDSLSRLQASIRRYYPDVPVVVVDTQGNVSRGRNEAVRLATTKYVVILEDDFELTPATRLDALLDVLTTDPRVGLVSGLIDDRKLERVVGWCHDYDPFRGELGAVPATRPWQFTPAGTQYRVCELVHNFVAARRETLVDTPWCEALPIQEHREFFWRVRQARTWKVAHTPAVTITHYVDRPSQAYTDARGRNLRDEANRQIGLQLVPVTPARPNRNNIVVLGVGHSNTTITARQLAALGWATGDADAAFCESVSVRAINAQYLRTGQFPLARAVAALRDLPRNWVVKDPRFAKGALPRWLPAFEPHQPLLLWLTKDLATVRDSYARRGQSAQHVGDWYSNCERYYREWPWGKLRLDAGQIATACQLFSP